MERRSFMKAATAGLVGASISSSNLAGTPGTGRIVTVTGIVDPEDAGVLLPHEHVMSRFGAEISDNPVYDSGILNNRVRPYLEYLNGLGVGTVADCTTRYFGRDVRILKEMSDRSGLRIIANTGYYGAAGDRYVPEHAYLESAEKLAGRWTDEFRNGVGDTGISPGFIKIGVDSGPLSEIDAKLVRAAAKTHLQTGLVMAIHTGGSLVSVKQQLDILREEGASPEAWIWVHAQGAEAVDDLVFAAEQGAWIEFDGVSEANAESHLALVNAMKSRGLLERVLLSHDGNSYNAVGKGLPKGYDALLTTFVPLLESNGYSEDEMRRLIRGNPQAAFTVRIREA